MKRSTLVCTDGLYRPSTYCFISDRYMVLGEIKVFRSVMSVSSREKLINERRRRI